MNYSTAESIAEQALYITKIDDLKYYTKEYSRIYFGSEFCQRLIPSASEIKHLIEFICKNNLEFTFVTPFVTDDGLAELKPLFKLIAEEKPGSEVVFNDWGVLCALNGEYHNLKPILGRLLNKMKRGPRLMNLLDILPPAAIEYYQSCSIETTLFREFLTENRVRRVELDNLLQGIDLKPVDLEISISLHIPYAYVTTTRFCLAASCDVHGEEDKVGIFPCNKECQKYTFRMSNPVMGTPLIRKGNTIYFKNDRLPEKMKEQNINRLVIQPEL